MAMATPDTEYYTTTQVDPSAGATGSAIGTTVGLGLGALLGWLAAPVTAGASAVAGTAAAAGGAGTAAAAGGTTLAAAAPYMAIGGGLGASVFGQVGGAAGMAAGEEDVRLPVGTSPGRPNAPGPSSLSNLATQGWAWERVFTDMDKKAAQKNVHAAELQHLLSRGSSDLARFESNASAYTELPSPEPSWARFSL